VNAIDRIDDVGPWYLVDGVTKVFNNKANLLTIPLSAIVTDESGAFPSWTNYSDAWTGTNESGQDSTYDCSGWTTNVTDDYATVGSGQVDQTWGGTVNAPLACSSLNGLICFEQ
jgi:hypothetical protein